MKHLNLFLLCLSFFSCSAKPVKIVVANTLDFDRNGEIVEVETAGLAADFSVKSYILEAADGKEIAYQLTTGKGLQLLIFQADVPAKSSATYTLKEGIPAPATVKTDAHFVPERKDDFAWENDLAAYRMYGPALANEYPSNGVDLWLKNTETPIMAQFYADELQRGVSYHVNHGLGLDCYDVKHTMGAGGIAPYTSKLWIGNHYDHYELLETGPLRSVFTLVYDSVLVDDTYYKQTITITADAGSMLNKAHVRYEGLDKPLRLAAGIFLHKARGNTFFDKENQVIAYAENAVSNAGVPEGRNYVGVYMPEATGNPLEEDNHYLILAHYSVGSEFVYYFGGGWSKWKYPTDEDWFKALLRFSRAKKEPLKRVPIFY